MSRAKIHFLIIFKNAQGMPYLAALCIFLPLSYLESVAECLIRAVRIFTADADAVSVTAMRFIVDAVGRLAVDLQLVLRGFENVFEETVLVLVKASAAGFFFLDCLMAVHHDCLFAATVVRIVHTICYATFKIGHNKCIPPMKLITGSPGTQKGPGFRKNRYIESMHLKDNLYSVFKNQMTDGSIYCSN
jgi:hypothetical protein